MNTSTVPAQNLQWKMNSAIGPLYLVASEKGLAGILWSAQEIPFLESLSDRSPQADFIKNAMDQLEEYFLGKRTYFDLVVDVQGTPFQQKVWNELVQIPYGETVSYKNIADKLNTRGVRAVGTANGRNPLSIVVPCHRVISSNGSLGGYAGGLEIKSRLLNLESELGKI